MIVQDITVRSLCGADEDASGRVLNGRQSFLNITKYFYDAASGPPKPRYYDSML